VFIIILSKILRLQEPSYPKSFAELTRKPRGLILVTGPAGPEESTTLVVMMNSIDSTDHAHVLTVEVSVDAVRVTAGRLKEMSSTFQSPEQEQQIVSSVMGQQQRPKFGNNRERNFAISGGDAGRFA